MMWEDHSTVTDEKPSEGEEEGFCYTRETILQMKRRALLQKRKV